MPWAGGVSVPWAGGVSVPWAGGVSVPWAGGVSMPWAGGVSVSWAGSVSVPWAGGVSVPWAGTIFPFSSAYVLAILLVPTTILELKFSSVLEGTCLSKKASACLQSKEISKIVFCGNSA
ncbi:MAG: hypothetical protein CVU84_11215 [Firmicutes bacterium HGW-Firmicutes-1]|nr:MAG: hypothetical protein CVU84_11215 [Firmicutes bacterium HGW-Firmicutes-1]